MVFQGKLLYPQVEVIVVPGASVEKSGGSAEGYLAQAQRDIAFVTVPDALVVVPILIATGIVLAAVSANIAISRYLRV